MTEAQLTLFIVRLLKGQHDRIGANRRDFQFFSVGWSKCLHEREQPEETYLFGYWGYSFCWEFLNAD